MTWGTYLDFPVMTANPNWAEPVKQSYVTDVEVLQYLGIGRSWSQQAETALAWEAEFLLESRAEILELRAAYDQVKGRWGRFWCPTWQADVKVTEAIGAADSVLVIENMDYGAHWGTAGYEVTGRYLRLQFPDGTVAYRRVTAWPTSTSLTLDAAVGQDVAESELGQLLVSFLLFARFDQDELVIEYLTESVAKAALRFRAVAAEAVVLMTTTTSSSTTTTTT